MVPSNDALWIIDVHAQTMTQQLHSDITSGVTHKQVCADVIITNTVTSPQPSQVQLQMLCRVCQRGTASITVSL